MVSTGWPSLRYPKPLDTSNLQGLCALLWIDKILDMESLPQRALLVTFDLLKEWRVVQVSCHVPTTVVSFGAKQGSLSIVAACTQRPTITTMCLSRGRKCAGNRRKRFSWPGVKSPCWKRGLRSEVTPWQSNSWVDLLRPSRRCSSQQSKRESWNHWLACIEHKTAQLGGVLPLWLVLMERLTVGWMGVIPLKPIPASVHHHCHPRLLKNSLRPGLSGPKRLTLLTSAGGRMPWKRRWRELN